MSIRIVDGSILMVGGAIVTNDDCCCDGGGGDPPPGSGCGCLFEFLGSFDVQIAGVTDDNCTDADPNINGLRELPFSTSSSATCVWQLVQEDQCCASFPFTGFDVTTTVEVIDLGPSYLLRVQLSITLVGGNATVTYQLAMGSDEFDCRAISNLSIPFFSYSNGSPVPGDPYDFASSTCLLTANP
jgi:hypothetical protein